MLRKFSLNKSPWLQGEMKVVHKMDIIVKYFDNFRIKYWKKRSKLNSIGTGLLFYAELLCYLALLITTGGHSSSMVIEMLLMKWLSEPRIRIWAHLVAYSLTTSQWHGLLSLFSMQLHTASAHFLKNFLSRTSLWHDFRNSLCLRSLHASSAGFFDFVSCRLLHLNIFINFTSFISP